MGLWINFTKSMIVVLFIKPSYTRQLVAGKMLQAPRLYRYLAFCHSQHCANSYFIYMIGSEKGFIGSD